jgi:hypothetical protein
MALSMRRISKLARTPFLKSGFGGQSVWGVSNVEILHRDIYKVNTLKDESYEGPFVILEIPPPLCPKCNSIVKNKCEISNTFMNSDDLDLMVNPSLINKCPIFGTMK